MRKVLCILALGGFAAHVGDTADLFHTHFSITALGLDGQMNVPRVNPIFCLPQVLVDDFPGIPIFGTD